MHFGSLFTALASYLQARSRHGRWLLRIDDLDTPRNMPGATDAILKALDNFGLHWDGSAIYQSARLEAYQAALAQLTAQGLTYRCACTRKELAGYQAQHPEAAHLYPGFCRHKTIPGTTRYALRIKADARTIRFHDGLQGLIEQPLAAMHGDFIIFRRDQVVAYQLAAAVDDRQENITEVLRGYDLLDSTPKQLYLQQVLGYPSPTYLHVPVIVDAHGQKLSKQSYAEAVDRGAPQLLLFQALEMLQQRPPQQLRGAPVAELLAWAVDNWDPAPLHGKQAITHAAGGGC